jgi:hypothetical protein
MPQNNAQGPCSCGCSLGNKPWLSLPEAAEYIRVPESTMRTYHFVWGIKSYKAAKRRLFRPADLDAWVLNHPS